MGWGGVAIALVVGVMVGVMNWLGGLCVQRPTLCKWLILALPQLPYRCGPSVCSLRCWMASLMRRQRTFAFDSLRPAGITMPRLLCSSQFLVPVGVPDEAAAQCYNK